MVRHLAALLLMTIPASAMQLTPDPVWSGQDHTVSFNQDVFPILQRNCQVCHRPGEIAPMSFLTYESTRPWAKAIREAVLGKRMPPWFADARYGDFRNKPKLTETEIKTLAAWADSGAPEGIAKDKPVLLEWPEGWRTKPDVIISIPELHHIPAKGSGEITSFLVPNPFKQDTWVSSIEIRPTEPSVVHHVMVQVPEETPKPSTFSWGAPSASTCIPLAVNTLTAQLTTAPKNFAILEAVYVPGSPVTDFQFHDSAKLISGGGSLRIEVHYTPNGKAISDQTKIGFTVAKKPTQRRFVTLAPKSFANPRKRIPPGEPNWETRGELEFGQEAQLVWLMPHMHLRGKDMTFRLIAPNGREETVLSAKFNFNWQLAYEFEEPVRVRKGTRMVIVAHHDNSANNPYNPDPTKEVSWGNLTSEEMVLPWFGVIVDKTSDPEGILSIRQDGCGIRDGVITPLPARAPGVPFPLPVPRNAK